MKLPEIKAIRETVGDLCLGALAPEDVEVSPCALCCTWTRDELLCDVSDVLPVVRGLVCPECDAEVRSEETPHVDDVGSARRLSDVRNAWGSRVVRFEGTMTEEEIALWK